MGRRLRVYNATHCMREGCDTWSYEPADHGFVFLIWDEEEIAYCGTEHLLHDVAQRTPD